MLNLRKSSPTIPDIYGRMILAANKAKAASNWLAAPKSGQILSQPVKLKPTPKNTVIKVAT